MRDQSKSSEATLFRADGVVSSAATQAFAGLTTPSTPHNVGVFIVVQYTLPLLCFAI